MSRFFFFFSSRRRHTRCGRDWSSDVCSSDLPGIRERTRPALGNHDYGNGSNTGDGYFDYFNGVGNFTGPAGDRDKGYYSYDVGAYWHVVVLNSECYYFTSECSASVQEQWL